jgi:hypothetical protein
MPFAIPTILSLSIGAKPQIAIGGGPPESKQP